MDTCIDACMGIALHTLCRLSQKARSHVRQWDATCATRQPSLRCCLKHATEQYRVWHPALEHRYLPGFSVHTSHCKAKIFDISPCTDGQRLEIMTPFSLQIDAITILRYLTGSILRGKWSRLYCFFLYPNLAVVSDFTYLV